MVEEKVCVTGALGLHARAAANLVRTASRFQSTLTIERIDNGVQADAKSILSILMLAAHRGTQLRLKGDGPDERQAMDAVVALFSRAFDEDYKSNPVRETTEEVRCLGLGVSDGVVVGRVVRVQDGNRDVYRANIEPENVERERKRFRSAVQLARQQLKNIKQRAEKELGRGHAYIFDAHLLFLEDAKLTRDVEDFIVKERTNAEWAAKVVGDRLLSIYNHINDEYFRERGSDIEDVVQRLIATLRGEDQSHSNLSEDAVVVAKDLLPSTIAELDLNHVKAIATDSGGWTSHMAIIARGLGLTAVVSLRDFYNRTRTGDRIIVDALKGEVILHPTTETEHEYLSEKQRAAPAPLTSATHPHGTLVTRDGVEVTLRANVELPTEFEAVETFGASGIGLFRSEFLLSRPSSMLSEDEQYQAYCSAVRVAGKQGAIVRLFDIGNEVGLDAPERSERNPALGLRAIRFELRHEEVLRSQLRAILRAATVGPLSLVIPMVSDVTDIRSTRKILSEELAVLQSTGVSAAMVRVGAMIEVPAAVLIAERIAREVDFFELGTNDLVQYTLAVDRGNDDVSAWFRTLHPAVLYGIQRTIKAAIAANIPVIVCGEMASTPAYAILLVAMGAVELSMTPALIPRVRHVLSQIDSRQFQEVITRCLECATADDSEHIVKTELGKLLPELFPVIAHAGSSST